MTPETGATQPEEGFGPTLHKFVGAEEAPEYYADALNVHTTVYGTSIHFGTRAIAQVGSRTRVHGVLRLSPQLAKVLAGILMHQIRIYEREIGVITIPPDTIDSVGIAKEMKQLGESDGN